MEKDYLEVLMNTIATPKDALTFLHNTKKKEVAQNILNNGFRFNSHLDYSTDCVSAKDEVTVKYFTLTRQAYGDFTVIIQIGKQIIEYYSHILEHKKHHFSELLTVEPPVLGSDDDYIYQLAPQFVRGFIDSKSGEFYANPNFNADYNNKIFQNNLDRILKGES